MEKTPILGPSQRLKKLTGALSCVHKAPKCIQSLWDHPKTTPFVQNTKKARYVRSLGKNPILGHSKRLKKVLLSTQSVCARLRTLPIIMQIPRGYQKKSLLCRKSAILSIRWKKPHFGAFPEAQKANWRPQLRAQSSQMHSIPLGPSENNSFCAKNKEGAICAILREKTPFWGLRRGSKRCCYLRNLSAQGCALSQNNANPSGLSEKKVYCVESLRFCQ